jgi:alkyl hydroperoxide reductase subunit AhpC|tara:strand:+ start:186 stop:431 length:246 start_codon:yes stop_codon:yes gene_type:complete
MFLSDLTEEDWVFMVTPDGTLKAMMVPKLEVGCEINETIIDIFEVIDPAILDTIMDITEADDDTDLIQKNKKNKNNKETLH